MSAILSLSKCSRDLAKREETIYAFHAPQTENELLKHRFMGNDKIILVRKTHPTRLKEYEALLGQNIDLKQTA